MPIYIHVKQCLGCGEEKPLDEFYAKVRGAQGRDHLCKPCRNQDSAQWKRNNKDRWNAYQREYRRKKAQQ